MKTVKIIGIIPSRYKSSRFEGKPLADILGKPMVWWVFRAASRVELLDEVYVATEDRRVKRVCDQYNIPVIMTSDKHKTPNDRIYEVSTKVNSDIYVVILGDEPLIEPDAIRAVLPDRERMSEFYVTNLVTERPCTGNRLY